MRCLYASCGAPAKDHPVWGKGFRFCPMHMEIVMKALSRGTRPTPPRKCKRGHRQGLKIDSRGRCRACLSADQWASYHGIDDEALIKARADMRYEEITGYATA